VSTILEALSKANREQAAPRLPRRLIPADSPYVPGQADPRDRHARETAPHRWFWLGFGAVAGVVVIAGTILAARGPVDTGPAPAAASAGVSLSAEAPPVPAAAVATPAASVDEGAIVIPANEGEIDDLPHPFADDAVAIAAAPKSEEARSSVYLPSETPLAEADSMALSSVSNAERDRLESSARASGSDSKSESSSKAKAGGNRDDPSKPFELGGIVWDEASPMALINRECVHVGDRIGGAEVVKIEQKQVTLQVDGKKLVLRN